MAHQLIIHSRIHVHFLNLWDGSPHYVPPSNVIVCQWESPPGTSLFMAEGMAITGSRVMIRLFYWDMGKLNLGILWRVLVWDWKNGDLVRFCGGKVIFAHSVPSGT